MTTDTEGPRLTTGCACVAEDAHVCHSKRYGVDPYVDEEGELCECLCHTWVNDSDEPDDTPYCDCGAIHSDNEEGFNRCELLRETTMNTVNPWGVRLTDKELMSAVITCVMSGKQADRDDACRLLQGHIRAVEHQASGSYALGREDGLREAAHICQYLMTNGVRGYERANPGGKPIALTHLAQADDCLAAITAVMAEPNT